MVLIDELGKGSGIYTLILELTASVYITVGALGILPFPAGFYAYTGSARGPGGFGRVQRHLDVAAGTNHTRRWHIDHLLPHVRPRRIVLSHTDQDVECAISRIIGNTCETIAGFGSSDCGCPGHLHFHDHVDGILSMVTGAHHTVSGKYSMVCPEN